MRSGSRVAGVYCITHAVSCVQEAPARFGFIVSKAVGNAVTRNLVRRRMKTIADRRLRAGFTGTEIVFRALPAAAEATFSELERELSRALDRVDSNTRRGS